MPYESGQVRVIFPYIRPSIKQFIVGGPADGDEAQVFHQGFPGVLITGFEPNPRTYDYQINVGFPGTLRREALWNKNGATVNFSLGDLHPNDGNPYGRQGRVQSLGDILVPTVTLDALFHPTDYRSIALWIDIERTELTALQGSQNLLSSGAIDVIMLEAMGDTIIDLREYLSQYGYKEVLFYNSHDYIFCLGVSEKAL